MTGTPRRPDWRNPPQYFLSLAEYWDWYYWCGNGEIDAHSPWVRSTQAKVTIMAFKVSKEHAGGSARQSELAIALEGAFQPLLGELSSLDGVEMRGFTVTQNQRGDGYLAIVRVAVLASRSRSLEEFPFPVGNYCVFGGGSSPLRALAAVFEAVENNTAELKVDEKAPARAAVTRWGGRKPSGT